MAFKIAHTDTGGLQEIVELKKGFNSTATRTPFRLAAELPRARDRSTDQTEEKSMSGRSEKSIPSPEEAAAVLAVSPLPADRARLREILSQGNWELHEASDCREALALLRDQSVPVILCERDHADGDWEDLLKATTRLPAPPNLIVFSRLADESLWAEVLNVGGFDMLMKPFEPEEVLRVTFAAWSRWECDFVASTVAVSRGTVRVP